ncbi:undecaprenyl-diphosphate phosphatase, partial [Burkholderia multivorans]
ATLYETVKDWHAFTVDALGLFVLGLVSAFVSAFVCVRWLLRYVATHDFTVFAWYRIVFGLFVLLVGYSGWLNWA